MRWAHLLTSVALGWFISVTGARAATPPNILLIVADDLGARDLGLYGSTFYETPALDALGASAAVFTQAYAPAPVCSPSRAALQTGKHPARLGLTNWIPGMNTSRRGLKAPDSLEALPLAETTLGEAFSLVGYDTVYVGKWHLGHREFLPEYQGYRLNIGADGDGAPDSYYAPYLNRALPDGPEGEYLPDRLTQEAIAYLRSPREKPFFLQLSYFLVHAPITASRRHLDYYEAKAAALPPLEPDEAFRPEHEGWNRQRQDDPAYASMVAALDENIGRVLKAVEEMGLAENTLVIFISDNGGLSTGRHPVSPTTNLPFRAGKGWLYEGGIRIPLMMRVPGLTQPGQTVDYPVSAVDLFATLIDLAALPTVPPPDGRSWVPLLRGEAPTEPPRLFWHYPHYHGTTWAPGSALRVGDWKLIEFYETGEVELYDLSRDPGEQQNLATEKPEVVDELRATWAEWAQAVGAQLPVDNPR